MSRADGSRALCFEGRKNRHSNKVSRTKEADWVNTPGAKGELLLVGEKERRLLKTTFLAARAWKFGLMRL